MANIRARSESPEIESARREVAEKEAEFDQAVIDAGLSAAGAAPPPFGTMADVASLGRSVFKGDWGSAALDALGFIPILGDAAKGTKIAAKVAEITESLAKVKATLNNKLFSSTRENAAKYWKELIEKRRKNKLDKAMSRCKTEECKKRAKEKFENEMDPGRLPSDKKGSWVDENGNPVPRGTGFYRPDPEKNPSLYKALEKYGKEKVGIPFKDGHPDFSGFPPLKDGKQIGNGGKPYQVEIEMRGDDRDFSSAADALKDKHDIKLSPSERRAGTWHHESDGVTMTFVDRDIHTSYKDLETGYVNSGTPHVGGDSMWRNEDF
ncbi:HNH endonuclease [Lonsdalea populi]|nr:HNH endonuclease [Lonsdalea populi]OSM93783.1 hypothetical protein AU508_16105 [Lonsdalea populi]RAT21144.1 hypothetical protein AU489_15145 [Lonsdalea populi]RAT65834.1 hypothetical protein AU504_16145 [Lonsdalea populi]RAT70903.1 hypothetical protein AU506_16185 [Lonsdalea populi]RAT72726.1 hypothetical protein AU505_05940 [Lonsdalea populi]